MRVLVATVAHNPEDARVRHREIGALLDRGHAVTFVAPFTAFDVATDDAPMEGLTCVDVPRSAGRHRIGPVAAATHQLWRRLPDHEVAIVHDPELMPSLIVLGALRRGPVLVGDVHEDVPAQVEMVPWLAEPAKRPFAALLHASERLAERRLRLLLAEHLYQGRFRRTHPVVPNSTVVPSAGQVATAAAKNPGYRVIYVGAITAARGLEENTATHRSTGTNAHPRATIWRAGLDTGHPGLSEPSRQPTDGGRGHRGYRRQRLGGGVGAVEVHGVDELGSPAAGTAPGRPPAARR